MSRKTAILAALVVVVLAGCRSDKNGEDPASTNNTTAGTNNTTGTNAIPGGLQILPSANPRVRFKGGERWAAELSRGLELERTDLCREFGQYDCAAEVHFIALGGVEPYKLRIDEPLPSPPVTAPIAVERIALSACSERAIRDVSTPADAVIFRELSASPSAEDFAAMANRLYQRLLARDGEAEELAEFAAFWADLEGEDGINLPVEWATLACFAVASSTEMLFY